MNIEKAVQQAATSQRKAASKGSEDGKKLGKQDFLNLMMTQMSHQDPLDPMDSDKMMQQFTAMGTLEQLQNVNSKLDSLLLSQKDIVQSTAYSFLGKDVELDSRSLKLSDGSVSQANYHLEGDADNVVVQILDASGRHVRTLNAGAQGAGAHQVQWDGRDDDGQQVADQLYQYRISATSAEGLELGVKQTQQGRVSAITFENGHPMITVNGEQLPLESIQALSNKSERLFDPARPLPLKKELDTKPLGPMTSVDSAPNANL